MEAAIKAIEVKLALKSEIREKQVCYVAQYESIKKSTHLLNCYTSLVFSLPFSLPSFSFPPFSSLPPSHLPSPSLPSEDHFATSDCYSGVSGEA